jgi:hypothetical protein
VEQRPNPNRALFQIKLFTQATFRTTLKTQETSKTHGNIKILTPELNPSAQRCLTRFLLGFFFFNRAFR